MPTSSTRIDDEIANVREHLDVLEWHVSAGVKRAGMLVGVGLAAGLLIGGVAFVVMRRLRRPTVRDRLQDAMPDLTDLRKEMKKRLGR